MLVKDFPGGTVDKNQPSDAEDMGDPWSRKTSTFRKATKLGCHNYWTCMPRACGPQQKPLHGSKELYPLFGTRESLCTVTKTQHSKKKKIFILKNASKVVEKLNHLCINEWLPWSMGSQSVGHNWTAFTHTHTHTHTHKCISGVLPIWHCGKESVCQRWRCKRSGSYPWVGRNPWRRKWQPTPVFIPG